MFTLIIFAISGPRIKYCPNVTKIKFLSALNVNLLPTSLLSYKIISELN